MKALITLLTFVFSTCLFAQDFEREYPNIEVRAIASINIHESGVGYAPQECGSLLKTVDGGETWTQIFPEVSDAAYQGFVVFLDDNDPEKLVYFSQYDIIKTDDGFATSKSIKPNPISGLIQDFIVLENGNFGLLTNTFYYSSDQGETWMETETTELNGLAMLELDGALYIAYRAIIRSIDNGITFDTVFENSDIKRKFVVLNGKPIVSSSDKLYTSNDNGLSWEQIPAVEYYGYANNLTTYNGRLIANSSNRINYSDDDGLTWTSIVMPDGIYRTNGMFVNETGRIFIGGEASQLFATDDPNIPLQIIFGDAEELSYVTGYDSKLVATGNNGVLMRSDDNGNTWTKNIITDRNLDVSAFIGSRLFVLNDNNELLLVADDNSITTVLSPNNYFTSFEASSGGQIAYLGGQNTILRTDDGGDTWMDIYTHASEISRMHLFETGLVTFLDSYGTIYGSQDNGDSWQIIVDSPDSNSQYLDYVLFDDMSFILMTGSQLYSTEDGGSNWTSTFRPYNGQRLYRMDNESALCLGVNGADGWLYKTDDKGIAFPQIANTCSTTSRGAYFNKTTQTFWTVGAGLGIQKVDLMINATRPTPQNISAMRVYPNPGSEIIYFDRETSGTSTVSVFNILGARVQSIKGNQQSMDISNLIPGQYQVVITDGNAIQISRFVKL